MRALTEFTLSLCFLASRLAIPPGSTTSTTTSIAKEIAGWYPAGTKRMLKVSTKASTSAPRATPVIDSKLPSTMITNARIRNGRPKSGLKEYSMASSAPATPAYAMPRPNVSRLVRSSSTPTITPA